MTSTDVLVALFNGLSLSSILILTALGLGVTFGVMRVINMAHSEMLMLGAYTGYLFTDAQAFPRLARAAGTIVSNVVNTIFQPHTPLKLDFQTDFGFHLSLYWAIPICFVVVGAFGYLLETTLIRFLYGRPLDTLLATWGVGLLLQQLVRLFFGQDLHALHRPEELEGSFDLFGIPIGKFRLFIIGFACLCIVIVFVCFYRSRFGLQIRAVTQNRAMASALGISTRRVDSLTFAFGTGLAGVAGCIVAHLYTFEPQMGTGYVVDAFMVVILGGMGQLGGTIIAGILMGTSQSVAANLFAKSPLTTLVSWLPGSELLESPSTLVVRNLLFLVWCLYILFNKDTPGKRRPPLWERSLLSGGRFILAGMFLVTGISEIVGRQYFVDRWSERTGLPEALEWAVLRFLPWLELGMGTWLLLGYEKRKMMWAATIFMSLYTLHSLYAWSDLQQGGFLQINLAPLDSLLRFFGTEMMAKVLALVLVLGLILYRPSGLFVSRERTYD
jgi:urea transport system permease protein